jgi:hypothetical protein
MSCEVRDRTLYCFAAKRDVLLRALPLGECDVSDLGRLEARAARSRQ